MFCPKCKTETLVRRRMREKHVSLDVCSRCKGIWFDRDELEQVVPEAIKELAVPPDAEKAGPCPSCGEWLYAFHYPQTYVTVEMCRTCGGLWLDAGEAREIQVVRQGLGKKAREYDHPSGARGAMLRFVESAMEWVKTW
jgi:Zn-finger nucleic acid-binding protein